MLILQVFTTGHLTICSSKNLADTTHWKHYYLSLIRTCLHISLYRNSCCIHVSVHVQLYVRHIYSYIQGFTKFPSRVCWTESVGERASLGSCLQGLSPWESKSISGVSGPKIPRGNHTNFQGLMSPGNTTQVCTCSLFGAVPIWQLVWLSETLNHGKWSQFLGSWGPNHPGETTPISRVSILQEHVCGLMGIVPIW